MTREELEALVDYNPETGAILLKKKPKSSGWVNVGGYLLVRLFRREFYVHRIAIALTYGVWPEAVDHVNGNKLDNRISNLRIATLQQNGFNSRCRSDSQSGIKGVSKHGKGWRARIKRDGVTHCLGTFPTIEEASYVHKQAASRLHGEFAYVGPGIIAKTPAAQGEVSNDSGNPSAKA